MNVQEINDQGLVLLISIGLTIAFSFFIILIDSKAKK
jgi:hypothetical protein